jgi:hypothetical protein
LVLPGQHQTRIGIPVRVTASRVRLVDLEVRRGGIEEEQVDLEVQEVGRRPVDGLGQLRLDLEQEVHRPVAAVVVDLLEAAMATRSASHWVAASFESGSSARLATSAKRTRSARRSSRRPASSRPRLPSIPSRRQSRSSR